MTQRHAAPRLLLVQERLDQQRRRENLVARRVQQVGARDVRRAHRLALAAAQAVLDRIGDPADRALLEDQALVADQREARRIREREVRRQRRVAQQLALVEAALRIDPPLVLGERPQFLVGQVLELRDADPVLARDHAVERARERHDPRHRRARLLQHRVVVGVDGQVRVDVAVAGVHVQRDEHAAAQHLRMDRVDVREHRRERAPVEQFLQRRLELGLPRHDGRMVLQRGKRRRRCDRADPASGRASPSPASALPRPSPGRCPAPAARRRSVPTHAPRPVRRRTRPARRRASACCRSTVRC